jgi:hypothetical protein
VPQIAQPLLSEQSELPSQTPANRGSGQTMTTPAEESKPIVPSANDANTSAKRKKLETDALPTTSTRRRSSFHTPADDIYAIPDDIEQNLPLPDILKGSVEHQVGQPAEDTSNNISALSIPNLRNTTPVMLQSGEEITESPADAPGSGHRQPTGLNLAMIQSSRLQNFLQDRDAKAQQVGTVQPSSIHRKRKRDKETPEQTEPTTLRSRRSATFDPVTNKDDELPPGKYPRFEGKPVHDAEEMSPNLQPRRTRRSKLIPEIEDGPIEDAEEIGDHEAAALLRKIQGRRSFRNQAREISLDLDEVTEDIALNAKTKMKQRQVSSPAKQGHTTKISIKKPTNKSRARSGSPFPVTVHRLTERIYYDSDDTDADVLNAEIPCTKRGGVNAVDVLGQICNETINKALEELGEGIDNADKKILRREYRRKRLAIQGFGRELEARLLEHVSGWSLRVYIGLTFAQTINLDNTFSLEKRVRDEMRKKLALRDNILRIRAKREELALRRDEVRFRHEKATKYAQASPTEYMSSGSPNT